MDANTEGKFPFTVEGVHFDLPKEKVTAKMIIELAKEKNISSATNIPIEQLTLKGQKHIYSENDLVDLSKDNTFSLGGVKVYKFKVNGYDLSSNSKELLASEIIKMAQEKGAALLDSDPAKLKLEAIKTKDNPSFENNERVDLDQFNNFLIILNQSTPVA